MSLTNEPTYQADVNAKDNFGMAPLHLAARAGHVKVAGFLVSQRYHLHTRIHQLRLAQSNLLHCY